MMMVKGLEGRVAQLTGTTRTHLDILVDGIEYVNIANSVISRIALLYAELLGVEDIEILNMNRNVENQLSNVIEKAKTNERVVYLTEDNEKREFLAAEGKIVIAAGYGRSHDYFQALFLVIHPHVVPLVRGMVSHENVYLLDFSDEAMAQFMRSLGFNYHIPPKNPEPKDVMRYKVTAPIEIKESTIVSPFEMDIGTDLFNLYKNWSFSHPHRLN